MPKCQKELSEKFENCRLHEKIPFAEECLEYKYLLQSTHKAIIVIVMIKLDFQKKDNSKFLNINSLWLQNYY